MMGLYLKVDLKRALRLNPLPVSVGFKIAGASLLMIPGVAVLNITVIALLTTMFHYIPQNMVQPSAGAGFLVSFFVMAITPGICEELFFRGMMMNAFESRLGYRFAAVLSAVLFGLFHFNLANLLGPIFLGLLFAWLVQVTNSIYAGMIGHAVNNGFAVTVSYLMTRGQQVTMDTGVDLSDLFLENRDMLIASLFGAVGLLLVIAVPTVLLGLAVYRSIRLDYLKSGDLLKVAGRQYVVTGGTGSKVWLYPYDVAPPAENYEDAIRLVDVNALRQDRQIRMASRHWIKVRTQGMALGESLPLWAGAVIYIAIGIYMLMLFRGIFA
jgi:hypothetical protein